MRRLLFFVSLSALLLSSCGSPAPISSFYQEHKKKEGVRNMTIPGWLIYVGTGIAYDIVEEEEARVALRFGKKIKRLQFMATEDHNPIAVADVDAFIHRIRQSQFEELIYVQDKQTRVNIFVKEKKAKLKHLVFLINDETDFIFLNIRSNIRMKDVTNLINYYMSKEGWSEEKKKGPQA